MTTPAHAFRHLVPLTLALTTFACDSGAETAADAAKAESPAPVEAAPAAAAEAEPEAKPEPKPAPKLPEDPCALLASNWVKLGDFTPAETKLVASEAKPNSSFPGSTAATRCTVHRADNNAAILTVTVDLIEGEEALTKTKSSAERFPETIIEGAGQAAYVAGRPEDDGNYAHARMLVVDASYGIMVALTGTKDDTPVARDALDELARNVTAAVKAATN